MSATFFLPDKGCGSITAHPPSLGVELHLLCESAGTGSGTASNQDNFLYYYHPDHLGSSSYVTDAIGKVYEHLEYFPFGETWVEEHSNTQRTPYLFTAKELDEETGLYYFGARYYDPRVSVWQSTDPIDRFTSNSPTIGLNMYQYGLLNPIRYNDPTGKNEEESGASKTSWFNLPARFGEWARSKFVAARMSVAGKRQEDIARGTGDDPTIARQTELEHSERIGAEVQNQAEKYSGAALEAAAGKAAITVVGGIANAAKRAGPLWSSTKSKSAVENALDHWGKHASEFPELANAKQYVEAAHSLAAHPPTTALIKSRGADTLIYDNATNTFLVRGADGAPRTMFRPTDGINYWNKQ